MAHTFSQVRNNITGRQKKETYGQYFPPEESINGSSLVFGNSLGEMKKLVRRPSLDRKFSLDHSNHTKKKIKHDIFEEQDMRNW